MGFQKKVKLWNQIQWRVDVFYFPLDILQSGRDVQWTVGYQDNYHEVYAMLEILHLTPPVFKTFCYIINFLVQL